MHSVGSGVGEVINGCPGPGAAVTVIPWPDTVVELACDWDAGVN